MNKTKFLNLVLLVVERRRVKVTNLQNVGCRYNVMILDDPRRVPILTHDNIGKATYRRFPAWILA